MVQILPSIAQIRKATDLAKTVSNLAKRTQTLKAPLVPKFPATQLRAPTGKEKKLVKKKKKLTPLKEGLEKRAEQMRLVSSQSYAGGQEVPGLTAFDRFIKAQVENPLQASGTGVLLEQLGVDKIPILDFFTSEGLKKYFPGAAHREFMKGGIDTPLYSTMNPALQGLVPPPSSDLASIPTELKPYTKPTFGQKIRTGLELGTREPQLRKEGGSYLKNPELKEAVDVLPIAAVDVAMAAPGIVKLASEGVDIVEQGAKQLANTKLGQEILQPKFGIVPKGQGELMDIQEKVLNFLSKQKGTPAQTKKTTDKAIKELVNQEVESMKSGIRGVEQGTLITEGGEVTGRIGRQSMNDKWYRDFYKANNRKPTVKEMKELAVDRLKNGYVDEMFGPIPPSKEYAALNQLSETIGGLREKAKLIPQGDRSKANQVAKLLEESVDELTPVRPEIVDALSEIEDAIKGAKDLSKMQENWLDYPRVFQRAFKGEGYNVVKKKFIDPFVQGVKNNVDELKQVNKVIEDNIINKYKIYPGSKASRAIQEYGEKLIDYDGLVKKFGKTKAEGIIESDKLLRDIYNQQLYDANEAIARIYFGEDISSLRNVSNQEYNNALVELGKKFKGDSRFILKRNDYYRHFQNEGTFEKLKGVLESGAGVPTNLQGITQYLKPKIKWLSAAQKRTGTETQVDALEGIMNYLPQVTYLKHIDAPANNFYTLDNLVKLIDKNNELSNLSSFLKRFTNVLKDKSTNLEEAVKNLGGEKVLQTAKIVNNRLKSNAVVGNARTSIIQGVNTIPAIAKDPVQFSKSAPQGLKNIFSPSEARKASTFMNERYYEGLDQFYKFASSPLKATKKQAAKMLEVGDRAGTEMIWQMGYDNAIKQGLPQKEAIEAADNFARSIVGGRGLGEAPLALNDSIIDMVVPFQREVVNQLTVYKEALDAKQYQQLAGIIVLNHIANGIIEGITGAPVLPDPIEAVIDSYGIATSEPDVSRKITGVAGRLSGEALEALPGGALAANLYPEYGAKVFGTQLPTREQFFGGEPITRFGEPPLLSFAKNITDPSTLVTSFLTPFGGAQLRKTYGGVKTFVQGFYNNKAGEEMDIEVSKKLPEIFKMFAFGKWSTKNAQEYFDYENDPELATLRQLKRDQTKDQKEQKLAVEEYKRGLNKLGSWEEQMNYLTNVAFENPEAYSTIIKGMKDIPLSRVEKDILALQINNGKRAEYYKSELNKLETQEEQWSYIYDQIAKGLITEEVYAQLFSGQE